MNKKHHSLEQAFTLIELLVVMGIIVLMGALVVPAVSGTLKGTALSQASQTLVAQFNGAQQLALAKGQTVELRLIVCGDFDSATADSSDTSTWKVRALQLYTVQPNVTSSTTVRYNPVTKIEFLPNSIIIDAGTGNDASTLSTLCDQSLLVDKGSPEYAQRPKLARMGQAYNYYHFKFRADGSTDLYGNKSWYVTLHNLSDGDKLSLPPSNFFTVSVDPIQGATRTFRPM